MSFRNKLLGGIFLLFASFALQTQAAYAQNGSVQGTVVDAATSELLPGATVLLGSGDVGTTTDSNGRFRLRNLPAGTAQLVVSYIGYQTKTVDVEIRSGVTTDIEIILEDNFTELEGITIVGNRQGQVRALSIQKNSPNIKNVVSADLIGRFPDPNVAEALQRIPGISIQRDQGEGRYVQIRGTDPNLSNVMINGEQIAAPEGDDRTIALDMIPSDILSTIEVTKAITPDMDGDAIGGSINLNTLSAITDDRVIDLTLNTGYNNQVVENSPLLGQGSLTIGERVGENNEFGYLISGSFNRSNRASDNNEMEYDEGDLDVLELRDYELTRKRLGLVSSFDYQLNPNTRFFLNANYNYFSDLEFRRRLTLEADQAARDFKDRLEEQQIFSISGGGEHAVASNTVLDYTLSYSYSDQNTPFDREISYALEDDIGDFITFNRSNPDYPQFSVAPGADPSTGIYNYSSYGYDEYGDASEITSDQHFTAKLNATTNFTLSGNSYGFVKYGVLGRFKKKERDITENIYGYNGGIGFQSILGDFEDGSFLSDRYANGIGLFPNRSNVLNLFDDNRSDFELEDEDSIESSGAEDYNANEDTYAAYIMTNLETGKLRSLVGLRYENTVIDYTANITEFDDQEELITPLPTVSEDNTFSFLLPMAHLTYRASDRMNLRLAWTNTFSKPKYFDLAPYRIIARLDEEIELGNPDLEPARSMNLDFMSEYYFSNVGILSAGVFYKRIRDFIFISNFEFQEQGPYLGYEAVQPVNGDDADLFGFEVNLQQQLTFLPGLLSGLGIYANYTYTWSEARLTTEGGTDRTVSLPGQAENVANLALSYEKSGFSGRVSLNYAGAFIDEIRESSDSDRIYDERYQLDISANQQITPNIRVFAELINLTNAPLRYYNGVSSRPEQQEFYSWWGNLGVKFNF
jgi:TonB-dependent receptor